GGRVERRVAHGDGHRPLHRGRGATPVAEAGVLSVEWTTTAAPGLSSSAAILAQSAAAFPFPAPFLAQSAAPPATAAAEAPAPAPPTEAARWSGARAEATAAAA